MAVRGTDDEGTEEKGPVEAQEGSLEACDSPFVELVGAGQAQRPFRGIRTGRFQLRRPKNLTCSRRQSGNLAPVNAVVPSSFSNIAASPHGGLDVYKWRRPSWILSTKLRSSMRARLRTRLARTSAWASRTMLRSSTTPPTHLHPVATDKTMRPVDSSRSTPPPIRRKSIPNFPPRDRGRLR